MVQPCPAQSASHAAGTAVHVGGNACVAKQQPVASDGASALASTALIGSSSIASWVISLFSLLVTSCWTNQGRLLARHWAISRGVEGNYYYGDVLCFADALESFCFYFWFIFRNLRLWLGNKA